MTATRAKTSRPRDRKQQIIRAASELFRSSGYHNVGMADIAEVVGISGPALYRHFRGKQELLYATVAEAIDTTADTIRNGSGDLPQMLDSLATAMLERRHAGVLWERELTHLPQEQRHELRTRYVAAIEPLRAAIARSRPELPDDSVDLLLRAALATFVSMSHHGAKLAHARVTGLMTNTALTICRSQIAAAPQSTTGDGSTRRRGRLQPSSRREAVLAAATRLFAEHGYEAVGMEEIGAAAGGLAGPSLYHHFSGKSAILVAALTRCLEAMLFDLAAALDLADDPGQALDAALRSFVRINVEHGDAMSALLNESVYLSSDERQSIRRMQLDYVAEWTALLTAERPELRSAEAELRVHATHSVVNALRHTAGVWLRPASSDELVAVGRIVLGLPDDDALDA